MFFEKIGKQALHLFVILLPWSVLMSVFGGEKLGFEVVRFWKEILLFFIFVLYAIDAYRKKEKISADSIDVAILLYVFWLLLISAFNHASLSSYVYGLRYDAEFLLAFMFLRRVIPFWGISFSSLAKKFLISGGVMLVFSLAIRYIFGETFLTIFGFSDDINATTSYGPPPVYHAINDSTVIRFQGVLEGPNQMAFFLIVYLALYLTLFWRSRRYKFLNSIIVCALLGLIFETYSRSAYLGVGLSSVVLILISVYHLLVSENFLRKIQKSINKIIAVAVGILVIAVGIFFQFQGKFYDTFHRQGSTSGHFERMAIGWTRFLMHPAGSGLAQAGPASRSVTRVDGASIEFENIPELPIRELAYDLKSKNPDFYFTTSNYYIPESWYVQQLVEGGIIGAILFISVFLIFLGKLAPYRYVFGALGAVMVMNVFLHSFESVHSVLALFTMCAALLPVSQKHFSLEKMIVPVLGVLLFFIPWHALIITLFQCKLHVDISLLRFWKEIVVALFFLIAGFVLIQKDGKNILSWYSTKPVLFWTIIFCISSLIYTFYPVAIFGQRTLLGFRYDVFFLLALVVGIGLDFLAGYTRFFLKILFTSTGIMLVTFLIWYCFFDISTTTSVFGFSGAVSTFHPESCLAFAQNVSGHHRLQATFGGPIRFSVFVVTVYFLALGFFSENIRKKWLRYIAICVMSIIVFLAVFYSYSKTSYLGLGAGLVLYTILHARYSRIKISKKYLSLTVVAVLAIMGIVIATHADLFMHLGAILERQSNLTRTWYMFLHEPFGYGLGAAGPASQIQGGNGFFDFSASGSGFLPENWYLQILIEQGIIGFGIFIILMGMIVRALWKILLIQKNPYSIGLFVSFCVLLFMGLFTHVFEEAATSYVLFLLIGIHLSQKLGK